MKDREATKIVDEFLKETPAWLEEVKKIGHNACLVCGMKPEKMEKLVEAVKIISEKAWMYDDLQ